MKSKAMSPEEESKTFEKRCKVLQNLELASLVLSGVGTAVTAVNNMAIFAATPITLSLFLNILNRQYQDQKYSNLSSQNFIELQRQYASKLQGLRSEFLGVSLSEDGTPVLEGRENLEELATKVKHLESFLEIQGGDYYSQGGALNQEVTILRNHQLEMAEAIENLSQQQGQTEGVGLNNEEDILDNLDRLSAAVYELEQKMVQLNTNDGNESINPFMNAPAADVDLSSHLEPIQAQMHSLEERVNYIATADPAYDPETLQSDMQALIQPLYDQIKSLEADIVGQREAISQNPPLESVNPEQMDSLNGNVSALQERLDNALSQISSDLSDFQRALTETHGQMEDIQSRMNTLQSSAHQSNEEDLKSEINRQIEVLNAPIRDQFDQIQLRLTEYNELKGQLEQVQALADETSQHLNSDNLLAQINQATDPLAAKISELETQVEAKTSGDSDIMVKLQQVIEPLQSHMLNLEQRINQLSAEGDRQPLLNKIAQFQGQMQQLEARMHELPAQTPDHTAQIQQLFGQVSDIQNRLDTVSNQVTQDLTQMPEMIETNVQEKIDLLPDLDALTFEEEITGKKKQDAKNELDDLLNSLNP